LIDAGIFMEKMEEVIFEVVPVLLISTISQPTTKLVRYS